MKQHLLIFLLCTLSAGRMMAQTPILDSWVKNTTFNKAKYYNTSGTLVNTNELSDINTICYSNDSVWIKTTGMPSVFGPWSNPGTPSDQNFTFRFPKNPAAASTLVNVPETFTVGVLITGVPIFGNGDGKSYESSTNTTNNNGDGLWHGNAYYTEGVSLDTTYAGHVNQDATYHSHATPVKLYKNYTSTVHSPLVGFAFDGYPIYGPFGYTTPTDNTSAIKRIKSSYQLRSISTRTTFWDGSTSSPAGPPVNMAFPLGYFMEDYGYVNGLGDLDVHNGRYCVTPEYPSGTYAYFVTTDNSSNPAYPYYLGDTYYGKPDQQNLQRVSGISLPSSGTSCTLTGLVSSTESQFNISPNPVQNQLHIEMYKGYSISDFEITITGSMGKILFKNKGIESLELSDLSAGLYMITLYNPSTGITESRKFIKE
jgi:hypothetical protein